MDPTRNAMFPKLFHPVRTGFPMTSRTSHPVKYYFIDFGISSMYPPDDTHPRETPIFSGDESAPGYGNPTQPCDSYALDVYLLGNVIRREILMVGA